MILKDLVDRCVEKAPISFMMRGALENVFSAERLNNLFEETAERQENRRLLFSTLVDMMGLVACRVHPSMHAAYQKRKVEVGVTAKAVYDKLQRLEPDISRRMVRDTASRLRDVVDALPIRLQPLIRGYESRILDGNHLHRSERRIQELSRLNGAPLPGHCAVVLDPRLKLIVDVVPCEDGHAQERTLLPTILETVMARDLWIADRNYCSLAFLLGIAERRAYFIIRHHGALTNFETVGRATKIGETETGSVWQQTIRLTHQDRQLEVRRVTIKLTSPTRDGDREIHLLTNLPSRISALKVAEAYRKRWTIETAFQEVAQNLESEIETLGYPRAALFAFCTALVCHNVVSLIMNTLRAVHGQETVDHKVSYYYLADEVAHSSRGLEMALPDEYWAKYRRMTPRQLANDLVRIAKTIDLEQYRKHPRGPKKPKPKMNKRKRGHVSTARILEASRGKTYS